ncbi:MAG: hypothetical protein WD883_02335 [Candidatus Colwellbacteria bacterium]
MIIEVQPVELWGIIKQVGLAVAGASSLWGLVFSVRKRHQPSPSKISLYTLLSLCAGGVAAVVGWFGMQLSLNVAWAHEGITVVPILEEIANALLLTRPGYVFWVSLLILGVFGWLRNRERFIQLLSPFYALHLGLITFLISLPAWNGFSETATQLFYMGHGFHSILTLGSVIVLDFLFLMSLAKPDLRAELYPIFPFISLGIWIGLGIDFLSVALIFQEGLALTSKFFFMQTVVGIIIINGVLLSGPITRKLLISLKNGRSLLGKRWVFIINVSGTISVSSWLTIAVVDFLEHIEVPYHYWLAGYVGFVLVAYCLHEIVVKIEPETALE